MEKNHVSGPAVLETETAEAEFVSQPETPSLEHSVNATSGSLWVPEDFSGVPKVNELHPLEASCFDWKLINVILLGVGFMLNMGAVITTAMAQTVVLNSVFGDPTLGYACLAINCAFQALAYLLGPSICLIVGPKSAIVGGSLAISVYIAALIQPLKGVIYPCVAVSGFGVGIVWAVQGYFLTTNSTKQTIERNTGIFWGIFQTCLVSGNLFYFFMLRGSDKIEPHTRVIVFTVLLVASLLGTVVFCLLGHQWNAAEYRRPQEDFVMPFGPKAALVAILRLAFTKKMLVLYPYFLYIGISLTFWSNVYGTSLGYTRKFGDLRESIVGLNGVFQGIGEIIGGISLGLLGSWSNRKGRDVALIVGMIVQFGAWYLIFLNMPPESSLMMTEELSYIGPNPYLAMFCTVLIGFGDAIWNNQLMAFLGSVYPYECVPAFGVYQFVTAVANAVAFGYATVLQLPYQLLIIVATAVPAVAGFCWLEWKVPPADKVILDSGVSPWRPL